MEHYSTGVKMFENIYYYNARGEWTVQMQSRTVRYYCCEYLQEIYTDRTACMPQNLQASQFSWCKHQDVMQTRCSHDVRATGRHLRLDMMTHRDSFPILHNFYRLRYIMVSFRAHPSSPKNCITEDSCIRSREDCLTCCPSNKVIQKVIQFFCWLSEGYTKTSYTTIYKQHDICQRQNGSSHLYIESILDRLGL